MLGLIQTRLRETSETVIALQLFVMNLVFEENKVLD
jgi:hypothetical protein